MSRRFDDPLDRSATTLQLEVYSRRFRGWLFQRIEKLKRQTRGSPAKWNQPPSGKLGAEFVRAVNEFLGKSNRLVRDDGNAPDGVWFDPEEEKSKIPKFFGEGRKHNRGKTHRRAARAPGLLSGTA